MKTTLHTTINRVLLIVLLIIVALPSSAYCSMVDGFASNKSLNVIEGDVDGDGYVTSSDITVLYSILLGNSNAYAQNADVNGDGEITATDITVIYNILLSGEPSSVMEYIVNGVSFKMVKVEGGTFMMGAADDDPQALGDEKPAHQVTLTNNYYIGQTEVTQELWVAVMGNNPSYLNGGNYGTNLQRPVETVSWNQCQEFIAKLNEMTGKIFRLPTEAEWEFAARGGNNSQGYLYAGSNNINDVGWCSENTSQIYQGDGYGPQTVATKEPNELGLYDMSGNVMEWCQDYYDIGYYSVSPSENPTGPSSSSSDFHVYRSGCWYYDSWFCRVSYRHWLWPTGTSSYLGMRLALSM